MERVGQALGRESRAQGVAVDRLAGLLELEPGPGLVVGALGGVDVALGHEVALAKGAAALDLEPLQREVGAGYFDAVLEAITGGQSSTLALKGSTEEAQFEAAPTA